MTLTLASRHPELWSAAVDLFGHYDLLQFIAHMPESWKPLLPRLPGDPAAGIERSPSTFIHQIRCPLLVIQGTTCSARGGAGPTGSGGASPIIGQAGGICGVR
jgi:dipeptidyl aminopeptidase/acylaminoacyl peptidase